MPVGYGNLQCFESRLEYFIWHPTCVPLCNVIEPFSSGYNNLTLESQKQLPT